MPGNCTQTYSTVSVIFTVTDNAGFVTRDTCSASVVCRPPTVLRWDQNPTFFSYGTPFTVCANVTDPDNDVTQVTATYQVGSCTQTVAATNASGTRWCVTVPATCTKTCGQAMVIFKATDGCTLTATDTVRLPSVSSPPDVACWSGNPTTIPYGQPLTMCATVADPDSNVTTVTANYQIGGFNQTVNATLTNGRWCVTVPATCTRTCLPGLVIFTATDGCGYTDRDTCRVSSSNQPPVAACYTGNPPTYVWGQPLTICKTVSDADNNLKSVMANYIIGSTNVTVAATLTSGRWCVTIPATATRSCQPGMVVFTSLDSCDAMDRDTCRFISGDLPPDVACWSGNPATFTYGQPLTMCATVTDVNLATVTANYQIGGYNQTVNATYTSGRWCVTVPGAATRSCLPGFVVFTALDSCGYLDRDTCRVNSTNRAPDVACYTGNPTTYAWGQPLTICGTVTDADANVQTVLANYLIGGCNVTVPAVLTSGRYCVTIPANCTRSCAPGMVVFTATDSCGLYDRDTCRVISTDLPPDVACYTGNPTTYSWGQPLTLCANITDTNLSTVTANYLIGGCNQTVNATYTGGRWCVTIPANCTRSCAPGMVVFTATDSCGQIDRDTCRVNNTNQPPVAACYTGNPLNFTWGQSFTVCETVSDADNNLKRVTANYIVGTCNRTVNASLVDGRWCVTIPDTCARTCSDAVVIFTATDSCDAVDRDTCRVPSSSRPPELACWTGNPLKYDFGQPLTVAVTVTDPDNNVTGVTANYIVGSCNTTVPATLASGRWSITIPAACTRSCGLAKVIFTATDGCGFTDRDSCLFPSNDLPPNLTCDTGNPTTYLWGQSVSMCVTVVDGNLATVTAEMPGCNPSQLCTNVGGRWCFTVPATCTRTCSPLAVVFTATDSCGQTDRDTCRLQSDNQPPSMTCYTGNPATYSWGQPLTLCATVTDPNLSTVTANYLIGGCNQTANATYTSGRWCVTIPANCTRSCAPGMVVFTATDSCGLFDRDTCRVTGANQPPVAACYTGNPTTYTWGQSLTICETVSDADNNLKSVLANYIVGSCNQTVAATYTSGRWCVTIPGNCLQSCGAGMVIFTATDSCDAYDRDTCRFNSSDTPPLQACYTGNPTTYTWGQPLSMCVTVTDANLATVTGKVIGCGGDLPATLSSGRWCVTVPATCTRACGDLAIVFTATDSCGQIDRDTCRVQSSDGPPVQTCWSSNPTTFVYNQPLGMCVTVTDVNLQTVTASVIGCAAVIPVSYTGGRWCAAVPVACTATCSNLAVVFTATDSCGRIDRDTCRVNSNNRPPVAACYAGNPTTYAWGLPLTICETATDPDNNLRTVTASYQFGACTGEATATYVTDRWCVTVPATCTRSCAPGMIVFTATDSCGLIDRDTCRVTGANQPPVAACYTGNPTSYTWGQPLTICETVSDADNNLKSVMANYILGSCNLTVAATLSGGRWCVTIPATCTRTCGAGMVIFTATDSCEAVDRDTCRFNSSDTPPVQACYTGNPSTYTWGQPLSMCVTVTDLNLATVTANVIGCAAAIPVSYTSGRWCATIPATCTATCANLAVVFTATDSCGYIDRDTCRVSSNNRTPVAACYSGNPTTYTWGQPITMCETVTDADNNLKSVTANYIVGTCNVTVPAVLTSGRWCVTIPGNCLQSCAPGMVIFTALDSCDASDRDTCRFNSSDTPPVQACYTGNPATYVWGQPLSMCVTVTDANLATVTAAVIGCGTTYPATLSSGRWCATIPATCTRSCGTLAVVFTATDSCGQVDRDTCRVNSGNQPPLAACYTGNPTTYTWGQPLTICETVTDADNNLRSVLANYIVGTCNVTVPAVLTSGRWCVTIPANCLQTCGAGMVIFTATDSCEAFDRDTCRFNGSDTPPQQVCYASNPTTYVWGQPLSMCVTVTDLNLATVTAQVIGCGTPIPATFASGRWCATIPATCTRLCAPLCVVFTATDSCGYIDRDTCCVTSSNRPPMAACYSGNPSTYTWGQALTVCDSVIDPDNNLQSVTANYIVGTCNQTVAASLVSGRWCVTIPATCTRTCAPGMVIFTALDSCGLIDRDTCRFNSSDLPPAQVLWPSNPTIYTWGQILNLCVTVTDVNLATVSAQVIGCGPAIPATFASGRWCAAIPANCTRSCAPLAVVFTATDSCGGIDRDTARVNSGNQPPLGACYSGNPAIFTWGQPLTMCKTVTDADNNIATVQANYVFGTCNQTVAASFVAGRWCVTIPAACTQSCVAGMVIFTATDSCGLYDRDTCRVQAAPQTPSVTCWDQNPAFYTYGAPLTMCALVSDADSNVTTVQASYTTGSCSQSLAATSMGGGRWCVTIPANCTMSRQMITVIFRATDACGLYDADTCRSLIICETPTVICTPTNPTQYDFGLPLTVCADVIDPEADVDSVWARYYGELCNTVVPVTLIGGHYCVTVPASCTRSYLPIYVDFYAHDRCDLTGTVTCTIPGCQSTPPTASCWTGNPLTYTIGLPVTMCARITDPEDDVISVTARAYNDGCDQVLTPTMTTPGVWCITVPSLCTSTALPITVVFTATDNCQHVDTTICVVSPPENQNTCCFLCITDPAYVMTSNVVGNVQRNETHLVIYLEGGALKLHWDPIPGADYYLVYRSALNTSLDETEPVGFLQPDHTDWKDMTYVEDLPQRAFYQVIACRVRMESARLDGDRGQWEMNEGVGDTVHDASGFNRNAWRWPVCPPQWGSETDTVCNDNFTEYMDFEGYVETPNQCAEHLRVANEDIFYQDRFQAWARIRIHEHPTITSGAYYILSNHSLNVEGGGFGFRIDPGWVMRNGVREYHNRLTGLVYDQTLNNGDGGFRSITSPSPTLTDTTTNSVPLNEWSCVTMIVDGNNSMLLIDGRVVAAGSLRYRTHNNGVPLIIGAGYRHNTHPIEYPFIGEMDCIRITTLP